MENYSFEPLFSIDDPTLLSVFPVDQQMLMIGSEQDMSIDSSEPGFENIDLPREQEVSVDRSEPVFENIDFEAAATVKNPAKETVAGQHNFSYNFLLGEKSGSSWTYSEVKDKLFIRMNSKIQLEFACDYDYGKPFNAQDTVNKGYEKVVQHIIRIEDKHAMYQHNAESDRYSVVVPLGTKQIGTHKYQKTLSFSCQNSCIAIKRPMAVIFTLEDEEAKVVGRKTLNVKVCSGPNRDRKLEENGVAGNEGVKKSREKEEQM
ncbi:hypothetical protein L9F63_009769 [Diploptera punctata]|uniref:p53 DNA-binding domain-containing protein n=1 Tax=Diploptera punctata TaxID=6984 RepID=A0AAD8AJT1_DIPPU|nr:hypothetical protein L9F63_009769 [Diploptera punctata]